jgi:chromosome segregation ATPase
MVVTKIRVFLAVGVLAAGAVLLWRLDTVTDERDQANVRVGQLEQSNNQLIADLAAQRREVFALQSSYQNEQSRVADLVKDLEQAQQRRAERQKVIYEIANQSDCGIQPLPDELIRLRRERTAATGD